MTSKRFLNLKVTLLLVTVLGLSVTANVFGADRYRVNAWVYHLGELIVQPVLDVEAAATIEKVRLSLLVQDIVEPIEGTAVAPND